MWSKRTEIILIIRLEIKALFYRFSPLKLRNQLKYFDTLSIKI